LDNSLQELDISNALLVPGFRPSSFIKQSLSVGKEFSTSGDLVDQNGECKHLVGEYDPGIG
jgi:hypothetical protein